MSAPAAALPLSDGERETLERLARARSAPHRQVLRARVLLLAADGVANAVIADEVGVTPVTVRAWRTAVRRRRVGRAGEDPRGSGPQALDPRGDDRRDRAVDHHDHAAGCHALVVPDDGQAGRESVRLRCNGFGRIWAWQPHRVETFKVSNDPKFDDKLIDVVGSVSEPAGEGDRVVHGREVPDPGPGPHPGVAADGGRAGRAR